MAAAAPGEAPPTDLIRGSWTTVRFSRVVDGDTIKIYPPGADEPESVRILALDTEESYAVSSKPVTPWGKAAKAFAQAFFEGAAEVTIEFPGNDPLDVAFRRYRGNFGRLLVYVYRDGVDFQEVMIRKGYSPYYNKYGNAEFTSHHLRYQRAERDAQIGNVGVWDQVAVNGSVINNYAALQVWWGLRARIIDEYRALRAADASVYNSRLDYAKLVELAKEGKPATVFTEVRTVRRINGSLGLIGIGSEERPFSLKIEDLDSDEGRRLLSLLQTRYITRSAAFPRRGYCYVTGIMHMYRDSPQLTLSGPEAVTDSLETRIELTGSKQKRPLPVSGSGENGVDEVMTPVPDGEGGPPASVNADVVISAVLPDPVGGDHGKETVSLRNRGGAEVSLMGWELRDRVGRVEALSGDLAAGADKVVTLSGNSLVLNNVGDDLLLIDTSGAVVNRVTYSAGDVSTGRPVEFL